MDMSADTELLWPGAALLLLLGAAASLCVRCSRPGAKKSEKIYEQRSLQENQQSFAVARTYTLVREAWPGDTASNMELTRKDKLLRFSPSLEDSSSPRYQYFSKGSRPRSEEAYIDPTSTDYYNYDPFQKPVEDDDDTNSYENVLICKPKRMESGDEGSEDYQNSASIQQWRESKKVMGAREPFIASPGPLLQSRSASTLPAALLGGASTCPEDQRAGHAAPGLGKDSYREPTSDRLPRASLGSGGSRRGPVPRTGDSCVPLPALKTSYYMGVCVLFFRFGF